MEPTVGMSLRRVPPASEGTSRRRAKLTGNWERRTQSRPTTSDWRPIPGIECIHHLRDEVCQNGACQKLATHCLHAVPESNDLELTIAVLPFSNPHGAHLWPGKPEHNAPQLLTLPQVARIQLRIWQRAQPCAFQMRLHQAECAAVACDEMQRLPDLVHLRPSAGCAQRSLLKQQQVTLTSGQSRAPA